MGRTDLTAANFSPVWAQDFHELYDCGPWTFRRRTPPSKNLVRQQGLKYLHRGSPELAARLARPPVGHVLVDMHTQWYPPRVNPRGSWVCPESPRRLGDFLTTPQYVTRPGDIYVPPPRKVAFRLRGIYYPERCSSMGLAIVQPSSVPLPVPAMPWLYAFCSRDAFDGLTLDYLKEFHADYIEKLCEIYLPQEIVPSVALPA